MGNVGSYKEFPLPKHRELLGILASLTPKHPIQALVEFDVSEARALIQKYKEKTSEKISLTAWLIKCIAQAVIEHKQVQAYKRGKRLIVFDEVDVGFAMERLSQSGEMVAGAIVRKANQKTVTQIQDEIRSAQSEEATHGTIVGEGEEAKLAGFLQSLPAIVRKLAIWWYRRDPFLRKRTQGTVGLTSVGTIPEAARLRWSPIVTGPYPLFFGISGIANKPGVGKSGIELREYLPMSVMFDHEAVDGADVARFLGRLGELLESAFGLENIEP